MTRFLETSDLVVRYGSVEALHGVSLHLDQGEIVAVLGRNGAGKTTLLRTIFGFIRPAGGRIAFEGVDLVGRPAHRMARHGIAYVPENRAILNELSVLENLQLAALGARRNGPGGLEDVFGIFPVLRDRLAAAAGTLSGGQQQMLALGRAVMSHPKLLMLDEPSLGLAPQMVEALFFAIEDLQAKGMTILLVEQNVQRALAIASRCYLLNLGHVVLEGPADQVLRDGRVSATYLGRSRS